MADTLQELFEETTRKHAARVVSEREVPGAGLRSYTYEQLGKKSRGVAWQLAEVGVRPGDRVGILAPNRPEWGIAFFGALLAGAVVIPLDIRLKPAEVANILVRSGARACLAGEEGLESLAEARPEAPALEHILSMDNPGFGPERDSAPEVAPSRPDDVAVVPFSSGTTGAPKGVMLSHRNLTSNVASVAELCLFDTEARLLSILPIHHMYELTAGFLTPFALGATVYYLDSITPRAISQALAERRIAISLVVPALLRLIHKNIFVQVQKRTALRQFLFRALFAISKAGLRMGLRLGPILFPPIRKQFGGQFRCFISGGAAMDPNVQRDLRALGLEVLQGYGLTETSPVTHVSPPHKNKIGKVGPAIPGVEVKLAPVEGAGPDEGEVLIRGPNVMVGYYEDPEATAEAMVDGWFHTGDIGRLDGDGYLSICGRSKNVIVSESGKNIYPEEVEDELMKSPYFKEVCVLGRKSQKGGEEVHAVIVPNPEVFEEKAETGKEAEIVAREVKEASSRLADYKRVAGSVILHQDLPKTTTLKHKRREIIQLLEEKGLW
ncbi:MAG: AMP-dependent synthetase/ligase [Nitrospinota bacterium]